MNIRYVSFHACCFRSKSNRAGGPGEIECRAAAGARFDPDVPARALNDLFADRQSHSRSWYFPAMQPREGREDTVSLIARNAYPVVTDREPPLLAVLAGRNGDPRPLRTAVLKSVSD